MFKSEFGLPAALTAEPPWIRELAPRVLATLLDKGPSMRPADIARESKLAEDEELVRTALARLARDGLVSLDWDRVTVITRAGREFALLVGAVRAASAAAPVPAGLDWGPELTLTEFRERNGVATSAITRPLRWTDARLASFEADPNPRRKALDRWACFQLCKLLVLVRVEQVLVPLGPPAGKLADHRRGLERLRIPIQDDDRTAGRPFLLGRTLTLADLRWLAGLELSDAGKLIGMAGHAVSALEGGVDSRLGTVGRVASAFRGELIVLADHPDKGPARLLIRDEAQGHDAPGLAR